MPWLPANSWSRVACRLPQCVSANDLLNLLLKGVMVVRRTRHRPAVAPVGQTTTECPRNSIRLVRTTVLWPGPGDLVHRVVRSLSTQAGNGSQTSTPENYRRRHCRMTEMMERVVLELLAKGCQNRWHCSWKLSNDCQVRALQLTWRLMGDIIYEHRKIEECI